MQTAVDSIFFHTASVWPKRISQTLKTKVQNVTKRHRHLLPMLCEWNVNRSDKHLSRALIPRRKSSSPPTQTGRMTPLSCYQQFVKRCWENISLCVCVRTRSYERGHFNVTCPPILFVRVSMDPTGLTVERAPNSLLLWMITLPTVMCNWKHNGLKIATWTLFKLPFLRLQTNLEKSATAAVVV